MSKISCGSNYTVLLNTDGTVYATGYNFNGQLGLNDKTNRIILTGMQNNTGKTVSQISCGNAHTVVLMTDGTIYATGYNFY